MWTEQISSCIEDESLGYLLKGIPVELLSSKLYEPDWLYWLEYIKVEED